MTDDGLVSWESRVDYERFDSAQIEEIEQIQTVILMSSMWSNIRASVTTLFLSLSFFHSFILSFVRSFVLSFYLSFFHSFFLFFSLILSRLQTGFEMKWTNGSPPNFQLLKIAKIDRGCLKFLTAQVHNLNQIHIIYYLRQSFSSTKNCYKNWIDFFML